MVAGQLCMKARNVQWFDWFILKWYQMKQKVDRWNWMSLQDLDMYHEESDTPAMARTSNLNEELGQVRGSYCLLSDPHSCSLTLISAFKVKIFVVAVLHCLMIRVICCHCFCLIVFVLNFSVKMWQKQNFLHFLFCWSELFERWFLFLLRQTLA